MSLSAIPFTPPDGVAQYRSAQYAATPCSNGSPLYTARVRHYQAIVDANPKKAKYANGWANRNRAVLNHALELLFM